MTQPPPSLADWEFDAPCPWPPGTDEGYAFHHFFGKTLEAAEERFAKDPYGSREDFSYMPDICRQYYITAFANYLLSPKSREDADAATSFVSVVDELAPIFARCDLPTRTTLLKALTKIASDLIRYDIEAGAYGGIEARIAKCHSQLELVR